MLSVCVAGGGVAGAAAACEAAESGARVTLFEASEEMGPERMDWADPLGSAGPPQDSQGELARAGVHVMLGAKVVGVSSARSVVSSKGRETFEAVVLATGRRSCPKRIPGMDKAGVYVLDTLQACHSLRSAAESSRSIAVSGRGLPALRVADRLSRRGPRVTLMTRGGLDASVFPELHSILWARAKASGVTILDSEAERAVGVDELEGVVREGRVHPCDLMALVPASIPSYPLVDAATGPRGGILVDSRLRSSADGLYAAGSCSELGPPAPPWCVETPASAPAMGRAAGANASGGIANYRPVRSVDFQAFGLRVASAGLTIREAGVAGIPADLTVRRPGPASCCWVVHRRSDRRVIGIQLVEEPAGRSPNLALAVSIGASLTDLAYGEFAGSTDISLVAETAREGLRRAT